MGGKKSQEPPATLGTERVVGTSALGEDDKFDRLFRPKTFDEFIGQEKHKQNLHVYVEAAKKRQEPLDHILLCGPPGLGKTTLAHMLHRDFPEAEISISYTTRAPRAHRRSRRR